MRSGSAELAHDLSTQPGRHEKAVGLRYGAALAFVALAFAVRAALDTFLGNAHPFPMFLAATVLAAWYGGIGPALVALICGYLVANWFFMPPRHSFADFDSLHLFSLATYITTGLVMSLAVNAAQIATRRTRQRATQLEQERERFRITLSSIGDAVIATDAHGRVVFMNPVAEELTGYTQQEMYEQPLQTCFKIHNELTGKPVDNPVIKVLRQGIIVGLANHTVLTSKGGREIPIDDSAAPIRDPSGEMTGTVLVFRDVSAQRAAELGMRRLAAIVDSSDDAIVGKNLNGIVTSWNKGAERIFGYSAAEMVGQSITVLIPSERQDEEQTILERLQRGERVDHFETVRQTRAGQRIHVSLSISRIRDAEGRLVGASKIARDITDRKRAEQALQIARDELRRHADDLERRVNQRTASLQQSLKSMETVLYTIAHDLRSPNRAMQGFAQLLVEEYGSQLNETACSYLNRISDAAVKNDTLICDLLEYGRLAHAELPMGRIDLGQSVQKVVNDLRPQITSKDAIIEAAQEMPCVWANDSVLSQIITNLLTNALKFTSDGAPPHIRVWADASVAGSPPSVKLFVQDDGIGIPQEIQPGLFQPFQRGVVDRSYEGAGMGLAIVQKGAERLGGKVGLQSTPGKGSTFWIELLPANVVEQPMSNEPKDPAARR
jgi:PAS domain S-box-containing protein